jgi:flagellin-like hook-associated protein FlgL
VILARVKLWAAAIATALLGLWAMLAKARRDGRKQERAENRVKAAETSLKTIKDVENAIDRSRASGGSWHDRLRAHRDKR